MNVAEIKPDRFRWFDYPEDTLPVDLDVGSRALISGHSASNCHPGMRV